MQKFLGQGSNPQHGNCNAGSLTTRSPANFLTLLMSTGAVSPLSEIPAVSWSSDRQLPATCSLSPLSFCFLQFAKFSSICSPYFQLPVLGFYHDVPGKPMHRGPVTFSKSASQSMIGSSHGLLCGTRLRIPRPSPSPLPCWEGLGGPMAGAEDVLELLVLDPSCPSRWPCVCWFINGSCSMAPKPIFHPLCHSSYFQEF